MCRLGFSALLLSTALVLAGCGPHDSLDDAQATCSAATSSFAASWQCIRSRVASGTAGQMGDLLADRVKSHQLTDLEARAQLAAELQQMDTAFMQQQTMIAANGPVVCNRFGTTTVCN